jgi:hypothetical protein
LVSHFLLLSYWVTHRLRRVAARRRHFFVPGWKNG